MVPWRKELHYGTASLPWEQRLVYSPLPGELRAAEPESEPTLAKRQS